MSTKDMPTRHDIEVASIGEKQPLNITDKPLGPLDFEGPSMKDIQAERRDLARDFVTLKHTIAQLRADRDRLSVENRDLQMRLAAIETDYANLFSYVEGRQAEA